MELSEKIPKPTDDAGQRGMQTMVVVDQMDERTLRLRIGESLGDRNDIVVPAVNDDSWTGLRRWRRR